jgi:hypothetical protein
MAWFLAYVVVDMYVDDCIKNGRKKFAAWQLGYWIANHTDPRITAWKGQASQILQAHRLQQQWAGPHNGMATRHRIKCERKGPDAPWFIEHAGSWRKAHTLNWAEKMRAGFVEDACSSMPMAKQEDALAGVVKIKITDKDGPALTTCKLEITRMGYGVNAALVAAGLPPIDVPRLLTRY